MNLIQSTFTSTGKALAAIAIFALVFAPFANMQFAKAAQQGGGNTGSVNTVSGSCGAPVNVNQYAVGEAVLLKGKDFDANVTLLWSIAPAQGGGNAVSIAQGSLVTDNAGNFCIIAIQSISQSITLAEYKASVANAKTDNFKIVAGQAATGNVTIVKQVNDASGNTVSFNFASSFPINGNFVLNGGQSASFLSQDAGIYTISEIAQPQDWSFSSVSCNSGVWSANGSTLSVTLVGGENMICTFVNTKPIAPTPAKLTVTKVVVNDNGGTLNSSDFPLFVNASSVISGAQNNFAAGTYSVSETGNANYIGTISGDCTSNGSITMQAGGEYNCTITNDDIFVPPTKAVITVIKNVINNNGGILTPSNFSLFVGGVQVTTNVANQFDAGVYTISETPVTGYTGTISGNCASNGSLTVVAGQSYTCTITNDDIAPKLTVTKVVINDSNTGAKLVTDFPLFVDTTGVSSGVQNAFNAGSYVVSETNSGGYLASFSGDCDANGNVSLSVGDVKSCTITNDDNDPTEAVITVNKVVVNGFGGTTQASAFAFSLDGASSIFFESDASNQVIVTTPGTHNITEVLAPGYSTTYEGCSINAVLGQSYTCTITNTELPACSNNLNDDGSEDSLIDYPNDPGCDGSNDDTEGDPLASITIDKVVVGEGAATNVPFSIGGFMSPALIVTADSAPVTFDGLAGGVGMSYFISEFNLPPRWALESVACTDVTNPNSPELENITTGNDGYYVNLSAGEDVSCVFTNRYTPRDSNSNEETIVVRKEVTQGSDTSQVFTFDSSWSATDLSLIPNSEIESGDLNVDTVYTITENLPSGWELDTVSCVSDINREIILGQIKNPISVTLQDGETITCTFTNDQNRYILEGYVWHDANENDNWEQFDENQEDGNYTENDLSGWTVTATNGSATLTTATDADGHYSFEVIAGTWTISEVIQNEWQQTFPNNGTHVITVPEVVTSVPAASFFASIRNLIAPTAHAAVIGTFGPFNFGNVFKGCTSNCGGGGGGGGGGNGVRISLVDGDGDSDSNNTPDPIGEVLGESTTMLPVGAPNTGGGGMSPDSSLPLTAFFGMMMSLVTLRFSKNG